MVDEIIISALSPPPKPAAAKRARAWEWGEAGVGCPGEGRRNPATGELVHDDLLISAALCAELDALYRVGKIALGLANSEVVPDATEQRAEDPVEGLGEAF